MRLLYGFATLAVNPDVSFFLFYQACNRPLTFHYFHMAVFAEFSFCSLGCVQMKDECEMALQCGWSLMALSPCSAFTFCFCNRTSIHSTEDYVHALAQAPLVLLLCFVFGSWAVISLPSCVALSLISSAAVRGQALQDDAPCPSAFCTNYLFWGTVGNEVRWQSNCLYNITPTRARFRLLKEKCKILKL